jgi:transcriptional regulator with XRE-family HTH domain
MAGIGARLRAIRQQWGLSLREVEQRSQSIARVRGDSSFQVSVGWLARLESDGHELTVNKLIALAEIYSTPIDQLLRSNYPRNAEPLTLDQLPSRSATTLPMEGSGKSQAKHLLSDPPFPDQSPDETTLLPKNSAPSPTPYRRGIIGRLDLTLHPMIPPGSIVQIDTTNRAILSRKNWTHEFQRPVYFLRTREGCVGGWRELDRNSEWLTLIPHPLSIKITLSPLLQSVQAIRCQRNPMSHFAQHTHGDFLIHQVVFGQPILSDSEEAETSPTGRPLSSMIKVGIPFKSSLGMGGSGCVLGDTSNGALNVGVVPS